MLKKGQLVKTMYGSLGIIEKKSTVYREYEMKLIGNNFKFKGAK